MTFFGDIDHVRSGAVGAVGDALEIICAAWGVVEGDAGLVCGLEFHLVAYCYLRTAGAAKERNKDGQ
jgi:hypothetical protein